MEKFYEPEAEDADPTETVTKSKVKAYFQRACSMMAEICDTLEYDAERKDNVLKALDSYLLLTLHKSCKEFRETIYNKSWNCEMIIEASAESAISLQRLIILKRDNKALKDLNNARLVYMRCGTKKFFPGF